MHKNKCQKQEKNANINTIFKDVNDRYPPNQKTFNSNQYITK